MDSSGAHKIVLIAGVVFSVTGCAYIAPSISMASDFYQQTQSLYSSNTAAEESIRTDSRWIKIKRLLAADCKNSLNGQDSFLQWGAQACNEESVIEALNRNQEGIVIVYAMYNGYSLALLPRLELVESEPAVYLSALEAGVAKLHLESGYNGDVYATYRRQRTALGLEAVDKDTFNAYLRKMSANVDKLEAQYSKHAAIAAAKKADAYTKKNDLFVKDNPSKRVYISIKSKREGAQGINAELAKMKFIQSNYLTAETRLSNTGDNGVRHEYWVNGRKLPNNFTFDYMSNSLNLSVKRCEEEGAYAESPALTRQCLATIKNSLKEWGALSGNKNISDNAWDVSMPRSINGEINFVRWVKKIREQDAYYAERGEYER